MQELKELSGAKANRALIDYKNNNSSFPTIKKIKDLIESYDFKLTKQERTHRIMWNRKKTITKLASYLVTPSDQEQLNVYESKYGEINLSTQWFEDFNEKFCNQSNRGEDVE